MSFPANFTWGAAAAAYQIEGATHQDGRAPSVWDMFCRKEGAVFSNHTGDVACDHYHRFETDIQLMRDMGLQAYRLSIAWPRVLPNGTGTPNEKGLAFYDRLIDSLLEAGITPFVTLFHWDLPYELYCQGGFLNPASPQWMADYTRLIADRLGDRVQHWMTLNEPQVFLSLGLRDGVHAPGLKLAWMDVLRAMHHSLLAHGRAVQTLRERCKLTPIIGWAPVGEVYFPLHETPEEIAAARKKSFAADEKNLWVNTLFSDPIFLGQYPEDALRTWGSDFPKFTNADLKTINQKIDFYGLNIYRGKPVQLTEQGVLVQAPFEPGAPINAFHWNITPPALYWCPRFIYDRYQTPIYITENGFAGLDWPAQDGHVHDPQRIDYTRRHLQQLSRAIDDGADVRGYFHWSLLDNFEWNEGFRQRFGLIHVDYQTQKRTPKDSAAWYAQVIQTNGRSLDTELTINPLNGQTRKLPHKLDLPKPRKAAPVP